MSKKKDQKPQKPADNFLRQTVVTPNGVEKTVVGDTASEVNETVQAVKNEERVVSLDINNPAHGNLTDAERQEL